MTDQPKQTNSHDHRYYPEDEIELMDYLLIIWKWKYIILAGTFAFALTPAITSYIAWKQQPTMYRTDIVFKGGVLKIDEKGEKVFIDTPENIKVLVKNDLKYKVLDDIKTSNNTNVPNSLDFQVKTLNNSSSINVSLESLLADEDSTKLNHLIKALSTEFTNKIKFLQEEYERKIDLRKERIKVLHIEKEDTKRSHKEKVDRIILLRKHKLERLSFKERIINANLQKYEQEILEIESTIKHLRDSKDTPQSKEYILSKLAIENDYRNTFQTYLQLYEEAKVNLFELQQKKIEVANEIKDLDKKKDNIEAAPYLEEVYKIENNIAKISEEIDKLEKEKNNIQNIQVLQHPVATKLPPVKSNIRQKVILATAIGAFLSVFLAFLVEYILKFKDKKAR